MLNQSIKRLWPELVGKRVEEAKDTIQSERPDLKSVCIIPKGSKVTMDYRMDRVRIYVEDGIVLRAPKVG